MKNHCVIRYLILFLTVFLLLFSINSSTSARSTTDTTVDPIVDIILIQERVSINSDFGTDLAMINCAIRFEFPLEYFQNDSCIVELKCDQNIENIDILISPSIIRIENDVYNMNGNEYFGWIDFNITFIKGQTDYIFSSDMNNTFLVFGNWWFETGSKSGFIEPSIGTFEFSTICDYEVFYSLNENQYIGSVGEWKRIPIRIINVGNIEVEIQITGFFYLHDDLDIKVDPNEIIIPEGEERIINLSVKQKNGFGKTHQINLHFLGRAENEEKQKNKDIPYKTHSTVYSIIDYICDVRIITVSIIWIICLVIIIKFVKRNRTKKSK